MSNVTDINSKQVDEMLAVLTDNATLDTSIKVPHSAGDHLIVGEKYEMYAPAASGASANLGIQWDDTEGWSFTFAGTIYMQGELYLCTKDVHYGGKVIPPPIQAAFDKLQESLGGASPLCPAYIATKFIRPVTSG